MKSKIFKSMMCFLLLCHSLSGTVMVLATENEQSNFAQETLPENTADISADDQNAVNGTTTSSVEKEKDTDTESSGEKTEIDETATENGTENTEESSEETTENADVETTESTNEETAENEPASDVVPLNTLDMATPTTRQLPIQSVTAGEFSNVSYFDVGTFNQWTNALTTSNNNQNEITYINLTANITLDTATSSIIGTSNRTYHSTRSGKKLVVNGNGHTIDLRIRHLRFTGTSWDVIFQNINLQSANEWGVINGYDSANRGTYTFHNVTHYGHQLYEGSRGRVILSGTTSTVMSPNGNYTSFTGENVRLNSAYGSGNGNIEAGEIYIKAGSNLTIENSHLGSSLAVFRDGNIFFEEGGTTSLTIDNLTSNSLGWNSWTGTRDYSVASMSITNQIVSGAQWAANERPAGSALVGLQNSIYIADNTQVTIRNGVQRRNFPSAIQIGHSGGRFHVGENADVDILIEEDAGNDNTTNWSMRGNSQTPVFFTHDIPIELKDNASFRLVVGQLASTGTLLNAQGPAFRAGNGGNANFALTLGENAHFEIKSTSSAALIQANKNGSTINVGNQAVLDLESRATVNPILFSLPNAQLNVPGSGNYIHRISQWNNGNRDPNIPSFQFEPLDQTSIPIQGTTLGNVSTQLADGFDDSVPSVADYFRTNINSLSQRWKIEPIVFNVKTIEDITNETKSTYTVRGTAEPPGGYVSLSGGPFDNSSLTDEQKKVRIQSNGTFEWTGALDRPFYWGETIRVTYVGHTGNFHETNVKDVTKPTGVGRTIHVKEQETTPAAKDFIASVEDTNALETDKDKFGYRFLGTTIQDGMPAGIFNGEDVQEFEDQIIIDDTRGNESDPVDVKLVVHKRSTIDEIKAADISVRLSDVSSFTPNSPEYAEYLIRSAGGSATTIINGELVDLSSSIEVENLAAVPNNVGGPYPVKLVVRKTAQNQLADDLEIEVNLTIRSNLIKPRDPSLENPDNPENGGTGENGELRIDYVPTAFDFGETEIEWKERSINAVGTNDQWVQVADERTNATGWKLQAAATDFIANDDRLTGAYLTIPAGDLYNRRTTSTLNPAGLSSQGDVALSTSPTTIFSGAGENSKDESTYVWQQDQVKLTIPAGQGKVGRNYQATITWTLTAGVTN
ncbi:MULTISPECIES: WxL domain-containing protein [unclassified Enterococcus]|uniref:WxL domain-containing protein n=1 Tax=unclassified Enterococcus TaxID=2608891 RepID=UPI003D267AFC